MKYIGIIGELEFNEISKTLLCFIPNTEHDVKLILIDDLTDKINLDVLIINDKSLITNQMAQKIISVKNIVLNSDDEFRYEQSTNLVSTLITYGLNNKSCVTFSSLQEYSPTIMQCCILRTIKTLNKKEISEQEFSISISNSSISNEYILAGITTALICEFINI